MNNLLDSVMKSWIALGVLSIVVAVVILGYELIVSRKKIKK